MLNSHSTGSSLWEVDTLRRHYCPPVSRYDNYSFRCVNMHFWLVQLCFSTKSSFFLSCVRFVLSLENDLTIRAKTTEVAVKDFSSGSYATIFGDEVMLIM